MGFTILLAIAIAAGFGGTARGQAPAGAKDFMAGFPPDAAKRVTRANWNVAPFNRWGFQHVREITATTEVSRGDGPVSKLEVEPRPLLDLPVEDLTGKRGTIRQWLEDSYTDAFLVIHGGKIVTESYLNGMTERTAHNLFSVSKSFAGTLAGIIADQEKLDRQAVVSKYVPELKGSAYESAKVQHLLDMSVGVKFVEDYGDPTSDIYRYSQATNAMPNPQNLTIYGVLPIYPKEGEHGEKFLYVTPNTDALGWVLERATERPLAELLSREIWSKLGAERDAYVICDLNGTAWMGGGLNATLRDIGRFGQMMLHNGKVNGEQIVPAAWIAEIRSGGDLPTGRNPPLKIGYKNKWWVYHDLNAIVARGVFGQRIVVLPESDTVMVKFSSWPAAGGYHEQGEQYDVRAYRAIVAALGK